MRTQDEHENNTHKERRQPEGSTSEPLYCEVTVLTTTIA